MLECVVNVSEGKRRSVLDLLSDAAGDALLDVHADEHHNRAVLTLGGARGVVEAAARTLATAAVSLIDLRRHAGAHPRLGAVDVVPFVPLAGASLGDAVEARDEFAFWAANELHVPCFLYGPERTLPEVRKGAFRGFGPDLGPTAAHVTAGAVAVGARELLVAYNVWLTPGASVDEAKAVAASVRGRWPGVVRSLGLDVGGQAQVSCNLVAPLEVGPAEVFDFVAAASSGGVARAELVGLVPADVLAAVPEERWAALDLAADRTIEGRLERPRPAP